MYVIFPAEDLICMTYGVAVPRFKPRPSLDVLREPLIPIEPLRGSTRPAKSTNVVGVAQKKQPDNSARYTNTTGPGGEATTPTTATITTDRHVLGTPILNPQSVVHVPSTPTQVSPQPQSYPQSPSYLRDPPDPPPPQSSSRPSSRRTSLLQLQGTGSSTPPLDRGGRGASRREKRRDLTQLRNATNTYEQLNAEEEAYADEYQTDSEVQNNNDDSDPYFERERSPSEFFETAVSYPVLLPPSHSAQSASNSDKSKSGGNKKKSRLHLSLGRLGRLKLNETIRVRDELDYHVANPTFTHENLIQRNYDAFFESGEPVYSLEKRNLDTPYDPLEHPESPYQNTAPMSSPSHNHSGGHRHSFFQHGLTGQNTASASSAASPRPKTVSYMPMNVGIRGSSPAAHSMLMSSSRAQSVELDSRRSTSSRRGVGDMMMMSGGVTPKGDRCPSFNRFGLPRVTRNRVV